MFKRSALALALATVVTATSVSAQGFGRSDGDDPGYWSMWSVRNMGTMKMMDTDGDHKVTRAEFMKYMEKMYDSLDKNKDGKVDINEFLGTVGG
ncbi:MAG: hypothetical protein ACOZDY_01950 [Pseudomonadota bacterium]